MTRKPAGGIRVALATELPGGPPPIVVDRDEHGPVVDGVSSHASLLRPAPDRAVLRSAPDAAPSLVLLLDAGPGSDPWGGTERREVVVDGWRIEVELQSAARAALRERASRGRAQAGSSGPTKVHAIIPGVVVAVSVAPGDAVTAGQQLLVIEAMKMQNELRAPRDGVVERVAVGAGTTIEVGDLLLVLD